MTIMEILVGITIMAIASGAIAFLIGAAVQAKMITAVRAGDTESVRESLGRMAERLRNAGFNIKPPYTTPNRCWDRVVAQDAALTPTASRLYVSGEILKTDTTAGDQLATIGYYVGADPVTSVQVVQEYYQTCAGGATNVAANSTPLSNPRIPVTNLTFTYYDSGGLLLTPPLTTLQTQSIVFIKISMTVQASEGRSGTQTATLSRFVMLRQPEPNANSWIDINENY
jgi:hypothetical protein